VTRGRPAVFLDRDGVLNERPPAHEYLTSANEFRWLPCVPQALAALAHAGYERVVVSNQRGIARGLLSWRTLADIEEQIREDLGETASIAAFYYCPHNLDDDCGCRKPAPGLLLRAAADRNLDLPRSVMIGDSESDVEAGRSAGCRTILVSRDGPESSADHVVGTLAEAAAIVLHLNA